MDRIRGTLLNGAADVGIIGDLTLSNGRDTIMRALIDGGANGGIAGTEDSRQLDSTFNHGSVKVTRLGESTMQNVPIEVICAVSKSINVEVLCIYQLRYWSDSDNYRTFKDTISTSQ